MIKFTKGLAISHIAQLLTPVKNYIDNRVSALASAVEDIMKDVNKSFEDLEESVSQKGNYDAIIVCDAAIAKSSWSADTTYTNYPYKAAITLSGITASHIADVVFLLDDALSGNFAPICQTDTDVVYVWARTIPKADMKVQVELGRMVV